MLIKICGITDPKEGRFAAKTGADFVGIIRHSKSTRYVELNQAKEIAQAVREEGKEVVAVFLDEPADEVLAFCNEVGPSFVQMHHQISLPITIKYIHAAHTLPNPLPSCDFLLIDSPKPGSGKTWDWNKFQPPKNVPWFLAGGLSPENVQKAIQLLKPTGVDVSSGVESEIKGRKDFDLIKRFIDEVRK